MKQNERIDAILREVRLHNKVLLQDLATLLDVSVDTVRRDVIKLHDQDKLEKIHGGAVSIGYLRRDGVEKEVYAKDLKIKIAEKALQLIADESVLLMSGGTTNIELARILHPKLRVTIFTPSLPVALQLSEHPRAEVIVIGGKMSKNTNFVIGASALQVLNEIKVDLCFMGTGYIDAIEGMTTMDWEVGQMKKAMIKASRKVVSLTISEKLNTTQRYKICDISVLNTLITELDPNDPSLKIYKERGVNVL